jgi:hypothetical protein
VLEAEAVLATDRHCAAFVRVNAHRDGRQCDALMVQVFRVRPSDETVGEYWAFVDEAVQRLWG